jgi:hypothetical protein
MTNVYTPTNPLVVSDLFNPNTPFSARAEQGSPNNYRVWRFRNSRGDVVPGVYGWELYISSLSGGLGKVYGNFGMDGDRALDSSLDTRFPGSLLLPSLTTFTALTPTGTRITSSIDIFSTFAIGIGDETDDCLYIETSSSNPLLSARAYNPTGNITALARIVVGGVTAQERLAICTDGGVVDLVNDLAATPTDAGANMNAVTNPCWGMTQTPINDDILIYANTNLYILAKAAAMGDAPTASGVTPPNGGTLLGMKKIGGTPLVAWMEWPRQNRTTPMSTNEYRRLMHVHLDGTDPQEVPLPLPANRQGAAFWRDGIVVASVVAGVPRIVYWDGQADELPFLTERDPLVGGNYSAIRFYVRDADLFVEVNRFAAGTANDQRWIEWYDPITRRFHMVSAKEQIDDVTAAANGSLPVSPLTGFFHCYNPDVSFAGTGFRRIAIGPNHMNSAYHLGDNSVTGTSFEASGTYKSPAWYIPGLEGMALVPEECIFLGQLASQQGETDAQIEIEIADMGQSSYSFTGNLSFVFKGTDRFSKHRDVRELNTSATDRIQIQVTATRGTDTGRTPNGLPFILRGIAFDDWSKVRSPASVRRAA